MDVAEKRIHLSKRHVEYLRQSSFLPASLARLVEAVGSEGDEARVIRVSQEVAEKFRSAFTDQLAKVGFGVDYQPTSEGRILEELIDRFFLGDDR
jgi:hypothetical protein